MKIGIDARSLEESTTGVGRYLSNLLKCWKDYPQHKFILYFRNEIPKSEYIKSSNFEPKVLKNPLGFSSNFFFQHALLPFNLKKDRVDFFFSPFYLKPFYSPVKSSAALHDISYEAHPEWFDSKSQFILRKISEYSAKSADIIFTISNFSKSEIMKYYGIKENKIVVTYLACDEGLEKTAWDAKMQDALKKLGINGKYILYVGSIFTRRHVPELMTAFQRFCRDNPGYQLFLLGKNHTYPFFDIENLRKKINVELGRDAILQTDSVKEEELRYLYTACEFVVYLSDYEGFGLPVVEAQKFDKPVITTKGSSLLEAGGDSALYVEHNTKNEIYASINRLANEEQLRNKLILLGKENLKRFSWRKCADEILRNIAATKKEADQFSLNR